MRKTTKNPAPYVGSFASVEQREAWYAGITAWEARQAKERRRKG